MLGLIVALEIHGHVYVDRDGDGHPTAGEPGVAGAIVAYDVERFVACDAGGQFDLVVPDGAHGIVWVRVPDGYQPGPVWRAIDPTTTEIDLGVRPMVREGAATFVVAADTHIVWDQPFSHDLRDVATDATMLDPPPAFFTVLGDITQGNQDAEFDLVDGALDGLPIPYVPVPGNHDWYDGGETWRRRYGPDNYSFDLDGVHFVVWNMAMLDGEVRTYLGRELAHVDRAMPVVALTHAPPSPAVIVALRELGVDYVLTGHVHANHVVDHDGIIELGTEPFLMGGLDFTPAGYRVITINGGRLVSQHRTVVEEPLVAIVAPLDGQCGGRQIVVAAAFDASATTVRARLDCATPIELHHAGGWTWQAPMPALEAGAHTLEIDARSSSGLRVSRTVTFDRCASDVSPAPIGRRAGEGPAGSGTASTGPAGQQSITGQRMDGSDQRPDGSGQSDGSFGQRPDAIDQRSVGRLQPPLEVRWTSVVGGHVMSEPVTDGHSVYASITDLADGSSGGVIAIDLASGVERWRVGTAVPIRGAPAILDDLVVIARGDGMIVALDHATGVERWTVDLAAGMRAEAAQILAAPTVDDGEILVGNQHAVVAITRDGAIAWRVDPLEEDIDFVALGSIAAGGGLAIGSFSRALTGVIALDRGTGKLAWRIDGEPATAVNATPLIAGDTVYLVDGSDDAIAVDHATGAIRWQTRLDPTGFEWGNAIRATPALADGTLVVATLYADIVALDAATGDERWRFSARPGPLRTTHYRGRHEAGFTSSPLIVDGIVWAADTSGLLVALDLRDGHELYRLDLGVPVLGGLTRTSDAILVASFDGSIRALATAHPHTRSTPPSCEIREARGCCGAGGTGGVIDGAAPSIVLLVGRLRRRTRAKR